MLSERSYMRQVTYRSGPSWTAILIGTNVGFYVIQNLLELSNSEWSQWFFANLPLHAEQLWHGAVWQLVTFQFLHGGIWHLFINCLMLYMVGKHVETMLGPKPFVGLYLCSGAVGGLLQSLLMLLIPQHFGRQPVVGASAGVAGLLSLFALLNRETFIHVLVAFVIPIRIRAITLLYVLLTIAIVGLLDKNSHIAHAAHLGGMLAGIAYAKYLQRPNRSFVQLPKIRLIYTGPRSILRRLEHENADDLPPEQFIEREVDPILDKILRYGIESLTERERRILEKARQKVRQH